eukprot:CAMPEP_0114614782 /NCGR_PEP_ID=MMETSP0168-20121206/5829_1 /TAXON_ID=95228 ORGANISM="Vannella sp., Strain DIVA3 517/6/12" /NCGR_SAMPLE_ID=MMETSP0168 /ASSEMBLY_ACC=CAM_ASM_000044 /LENGTH=163 /DNA_ID=CAMNT_0001825837 /DNA_START=296 /DNA_END=784 /DNA_ORIENTATION=-
MAASNTTGSLFGRSLQPGRTVPPLLVNAVYAGLTRFDVTVRVDSVHVLQVKAPYSDVTMKAKEEGHLASYYCPPDSPQPTMITRFRTSDTAVVDVIATTSFLGIPRTRAKGILEIKGILEQGLTAGVLKGTVPVRMCASTGRAWGVAQVSYVLTGNEPTGNEP